MLHYVFQKYLWCFYHIVRVYYFLWWWWSGCQIMYDHNISCQCIDVTLLHASVVVNSGVGTDYYCGQWSTPLGNHDKQSTESSSRTTRSTEKTKKVTISALTYPTLLLRNHLRKYCKCFKIILFTANPMCLETKLAKQVQDVELTGWVASCLCCTTWTPASFASQTARWSPRTPSSTPSSPPLCRTSRPSCRSQSLGWDQYWNTAT